MLVKITVEIGGRQAGVIEREIVGSASEIEEGLRPVQQRVGRIVLEDAFGRLGDETPAPHCCGRKMGSLGMREIIVQTLSGPVQYLRRRYCCSNCGKSAYPADVQVCTGCHRTSRPLAKRVCQLATVEHFPRLPGMLLDQHGVTLGHETILQLVHDVGAIADLDRRGEAESVLNRAPEAAREIQPQFHPQCVYVSCDGIMYCTNQLESVPNESESSRLVWQQMKVGCVYWQDAKGTWNKKMIWGRESPREFGAALFQLACRCGYREATVKVFAADGGAWCWDIRNEYFSEACGILDWFHASEHIWEAARRCADQETDAKTWANAALDQMHASGGAGLVAWLREQLGRRRGRARESIRELLAYIEPRTDLMKYPEYRARGLQIGTGMMESTCRQLVGLRLKGPGMHWTEQGALAVTALRATDLNQSWHQFWAALTLAT